MRPAGILLMTLLFFMIGCGGSSTLSPPSSVSGAYEFVVTSNVTGSTTLVEAILSANGGQSKATGPQQAQVVALENNLWYVNGTCPGSAPGQNSVTTSLSGNNITVSFNEGGNTFSGVGPITGALISGSYAVSGRHCPDLVGIVNVVPPGTDQGGFVGTPVSTVSGTFSGTLDLPAGPTNAALTVSEAADYSVTVTASLNGNGVNGTFALSGSAAGNVMIVSGMVNGAPLSLFILFDDTGLSGVLNSLVVLDNTTLTKLGLLIQS